MGQTADGGGRGDGVLWTLVPEDGQCAQGDGARHHERGARGHVGNFARLGKLLFVPKRVC
jgi:hypothetical protein